LLYQPGNSFPGKEEVRKDGQPIPEDGNELVNYTDDTARVIDPVTGIEWPCFAGLDGYIICRWLEHDWGGVPVVAFDNFVYLPVVVK
jgi:hypothetical protein